MPTVPDHESLRIYRSAPFLRDDGQLIRRWVYFTLRPDEVVELLHIEAADEDMSAPGAGA